MPEHPRSANPFGAPDSLRRQYGTGYLGLPGTSGNGTLPGPGGSVPAAPGAHGPEFGVDGHGDLMLAVAAKRLGQGLEQQMEYFLKRYPKAQMIVIDTLQKVREMAGERYSYASDYEVIGQLKTFADFHNICILIVHHTRKQQAEDSLK